jgi:autotransporter-associated beta strand protein
MKALNCLVRIIALLTLTAFVSPLSARAATHTWTGGGANEFWNNAANWSGGAPAAGEAAPVILIFPGGVVTTNNIAGLTVDGLRFNGGNTVLHGSSGGTVNFRGTGGTNIFTAGAGGGSNTIAATLPVTMSGSNYVLLSGHAFTIESVISGSGSVNLYDYGYLYYRGSAANTATGKVTVNELAWLILGKSAGVNAIAGPLEVNGTDGRIRLAAANQIADTAAVSVRSLGKFELVGFDETVGPLTLNLGEVQTGAGLLTLTTDITVISVGNDIWGRLSLGGANRTFNLTGNDSLSIRAQISNGAATAGFTQTGAGNLTLYGTNTFTGAVVVSGGALQLYNASALGSSAGGVSVLAGGSLRLFGYNFGSEALTLTGELEVYSTNTWAGPVTVGSGATIDLPSVSGELTLNQVVSGTGPVTKTGLGTLNFSGAQANTFSGGLNANGGIVRLNKTGVVALPGALSITNATVQLLQANQIGDTAAVTVRSNGLFNLNNFSDTIGSLAGAGGVSLGTATLTTGGNHASTTFSGVIGGVGFAPLIKTGNGIMTLSGTNTCSGTSTVNGGTLVVTGELPGLLSLAAGTGLVGNGKLGHLTSNSGTVNPGVGVGRLNTGNLALNNTAGSVVFEINGVAPGTEHDQINVVGTVQLNNATLTVAAAGVGSLGRQHTIIANDGADAVIGTFNGLAEGATITSGLIQYTISYQGGTGNDVVLTQISAPPAPQITALTKPGNGPAHLSGTGLVGYSYQVQANTNLATTNWVNLGSVPTDWNGGISFTDTNAPSHPQRFYRLRLE